MERDFLVEHSQELSKKHPGKYIAMVDNKLVAVGRNEIEVFRSAKKKHPKKLVSMAYIPRKDELVTLL